MAFDTERAARRLADAGMDERAANGVADVVHSATEGLATEASLLEVRAAMEAGLHATEASLQSGLHATEASLLELKVDFATLRADIYRALWLQGMGILAGTAAIVTIINVLD